MQMGNEVSGSPLCTYTIYCRFWISINQHPIASGQQKCMNDRVKKITLTGNRTRIRSEVRLDIAPVVFIDPNVTSTPLFCSVQDALVLRAEFLGNQ